MIKNNHNLGVIEGKYVNLREVTVDDAEFILELRLSEKAKVLHATDPDVEKQRAYIRRYLSLEYEWYWIVEDKSGRKLGCFSLYDRQDNSLRSGRFIMRDGCPPNHGIEADLMARDFAFNVLGISLLCSDTRLINKNMRVYHKLTGFTQVGEDSDEVYYSMTPEAWRDKGRPMMQRFCR